MGLIANPVANTSTALIAANAVYKNGQVISETDTFRIKVGDGISVYTDLTYVEWDYEIVEATPSSPGSDDYVGSFGKSFFLTYFPLQRIRVRFSTANSGAATLNLSGKGAIAIKKQVSVALAANDILAGGIYELAYDGTNWQMLTSTTVASTSGLWSLTGNAPGNDTSFLGTTDNQTFLFKTNNTTYGTLSKTGLWSLGTVAPVASTRLTVTGTGTTNASYTASFYNSTPSIIMSLSDDRRVGIRTLSPLAPLHIYESTSDYEGIRFSVDGGNSARMKMYLNSGEDFYFDLINASFRFNDTNVPRELFTIRSGATGGVGVNNSSPSASSFQSNWQVLITTSGGNDMLQIRSTGAANAGISFLTNNAGSFRGQIYVDDATQAVNYSGVNTTHLFYTGALGATLSMTVGINQNVGINTSTFNTDLVGGLAIKNGTQPSASAADQIAIFSIDSDDATATLGLYLEQAVEAIGTFTASNKIKVKINGTLYHIQLDAV